MLSFAAHTFRVVDLSRHGELVVRKAPDGHAQPCMSALEANDIHVRFVLQAGQTDIVWSKILKLEALDLTTQ